MYNTGEPYNRLQKSVRTTTLASKQKRATREAGRMTQSGKQIVQTVLVDTHTLMLMALGKVVSAFPQTRIVGQAQTVREVSGLVEKGGVDVIVFGISISAVECLQFLQAMRDCCRDVGIVVIQSYQRPDTALALVKQGVHGLLDESASEQDLADAISTVAAGSTFLSKRARELLMTSMSRAAIHLTARELEVAALLKRGESNFLIAQALGLKEKTIEAHLTNIYSKLGVNSRTEAIVCLCDLQR